MGGIYKQEGIKGFTKGINATFYSSMIYGFTYFSLYKMAKKEMFNFIGEEGDHAYVYLAAASSA